MTPEQIVGVGKEALFVAIQIAGPILLIGLVLGLIGWGISYAVVAGGNPQPPHNETTSLESPCGDDYRQGYKEGALKVKKSSVSIGGALGTLLIVSMTLSADSGY